MTHSYASSLAGSQGGLNERSLEREVGGRMAKRKGYDNKY